MADDQAGTTDKQSAPRHIVLLRDGTGNSRGKLAQTNVWRTYEALDLKDPADLNTPRQFAIYDDGVGSSSFKPLALLGGALGFGLARNVRDLYAYLCRMYRPGDRIYAFGFSRGAFTIRVLVGLIAAEGIVNYPGSEAELRRLVAAAYRRYRSTYRLWFLNWIAVPRWLRDRLVDGWALLRRKPTYGHSRKTNQRVARIAFLGLWDTVDAYGVPVDELGSFIQHFIWPFRMPNARLSPIVDRAVHALSLDDERYTFHPKLWHADSERPDRISQVWFAGVHSDVGGGYADKGLAHVSLRWVLEHADAAGLRFVASKLKDHQALSDENGPMNDSRRGLAGYYRYNPRRIEPLLAHYGIRRPVVHESVLRRIAAGQDAYAPIVLPPEFDVLPMTQDSQPVSADKARPVSADEYLGWTGDDAPAYSRGRDRVFNRVWLRRLAYFYTLAVTLVLLALPLAAGEAAACTSRMCWLSPLVRALDVVLPSQAAGWTHWYANRPGTFALLTALLLFGLWAGGIVQRMAFDAMRRVWHALPKTRPSSAPQATIGTLGVLDRALLAVRTATPYQAAFRAIRHVVLPGLFGLALFAVALTLGNGLWFAVQAAGGAVCTASPAGARPVGTQAQPITLDTRALCASTGLQLERGGTYELTLAIATPWQDDTIKADLRGIAIQNLPWTHRLAPLMKRELSQPWLRPMLRIGSKGADVQPLLPDPSEPIATGLTTLVSRFTAQSSGELYLYVNDAIGEPGRRGRFMANNVGTATGTIRQPSRQPG